MQPLALQHPLAHAPAQPTHEPDTQIEPEPHDIPSLMLLIGLHTGPLEHDIVPDLHGPGEQVELGVQATQLP
jgi:hypothetical protein